MKICKYCGGEVIDTAKKCKHCGEWLDIICPYCEGEVSPQATICPHCGEKIKEGNEQETIPQSEHQNKNQNKLLIIVLFTILILIFVIFICFVFVKNQRYQSTESSINNEVKQLNNITDKDLVIEKAYQIYLDKNYQELSNKFKVSTHCAKSLIRENLGNGDIAFLKNEPDWKSTCTLEEKKAIEHTAIQDRANDFGVSTKCALSLFGSVDESYLQDYQNNVPEREDVCSLQEIQKIDQIHANYSYEPSKKIYTEYGMPKSLILKDVSIMCYKYANGGDNSRCSENEIKTIQTFFKENPNIDKRDDYYENEYSGY